MKMLNGDILIGTFSLCVFFFFFRFELQRERSSTSGSVEEPQIKETTAEQDGKVTMHSETIWKYQSMKRIRFKI